MNNRFDNKLAKRVFIPRVLVILESSRVWEERTSVLSGEPLSSLIPQEQFRAGSLFRAGFGGLFGLSDGSAGRGKDSGMIRTYDSCEANSSGRGCPDFREKPHRLSGPH